MGPAALVVPLVAVLLAHCSGLDNGFTNWDDPGYLLLNPQTDDPLIDGAGDLLLTPSIGYPIPVTILTYAAERAAFGLEPRGFHATSLALHLIVVLLAIGLARRLGASWIAAIAAGTVFGAHPLVVEPVAWVVGQKDLLSCGLLLAALYVRAGPRGASLRSTLGVLGLVVLSLAAKPNTVAAPLLIVGVDMVRGRSLRARGCLALYAATAMLAVVAIAGAMWGHGSLGASPTQRLGLMSLVHAAWSFALQLIHVVWPDPLTARYFPPGGGALAAQAVAGVAAAVVLLGGAYIAFCRDNRPIAFGIVGALLAYAPASGIIPLSRGAADSYMYLPLAIAVCAAAAALTPVFDDVRRRPIAIVATLVIATGLAFVSRAQTRVWHDSESLWTEVAAAYPDDPRAVSRLGDAYLYMGRPGVALPIFERIRADHPDHTNSLISHADTLEVLGRAAEAERLLAEGARRSTDAVFTERYGFFLVGHPDVAPSDDDAARRCLLIVGALLADRGKRPQSVARAAQLLARYGERAMVERLEARLAELAARQ